MKDKKLILALDLTDWIIIHTQRDQAPTEEFLRELTNIAKSLGFRFQGRPTMYVKYFYYVLMEKYIWERKLKKEMNKTIGREKNELSLTFIYF